MRIGKGLLLLARYLVGVAAAFVMGKYINERVQPSAGRWLLEALIAAIIIGLMSGQLFRVVIHDSNATERQK